MLLSSISMSSMLSGGQLRSKAARLCSCCMGVAQARSRPKKAQGAIERQVKTCISASYPQRPVQARAPARRRCPVTSSAVGVLHSGGLRLYCES